MKRCERKLAYIPFQFIESLCNTDSCQGEILIQDFNTPSTTAFFFFFDVSYVCQFLYPQMLMCADLTPTFLRTESWPSLNHSFLKCHAFINDINKPHQWTKSLYLFLGSFFPHFVSIAVVFFVLVWLFLFHWWSVT